MFNGKAIYNPSGKAREYSEWACNLYVGCSNDCSYCYCKKGVLAAAMGQRRATLKKCFRDKGHAFGVFLQELRKNAEAIRREGGLFFSFSTDPCLPETIDLTMMCVMAAIGMEVPCTILTKCTEWAFTRRLEPTYDFDALFSVKDMVTVGFTLTGADELENGPTVARNMDRVGALALFHGYGFRTFASIEPVIDPNASLQMIYRSVEDCDLFKIGLLSGKKSYDWDDVNDFVQKASVFLKREGVPVLWKKSVSDFLGYTPESTLFQHE